MFVEEASLSVSVSESESESVPVSVSVSVSLSVYVSFASSHDGALVLKSKGAGISRVKG